MMATILYHGEPNGPSLTVLAALAEKQADADLRAIDLAAGARHRLAEANSVEIAMSVEGEGPVLVADGVAMADSVFIACYLDDAGPGPPIRPSDPYARWEMMAWCRFVIERIAPAAALLGTRAFLTPQLAALADGAYADLTAAIASDDLRARWDAARSGTVATAQISAAEARIADGVARLEARLADERAWVIGGFSIADLETYAWLAGMVALVPAAFAQTPRSLAWLARVKARPAVAAALAHAQVADPLRVWAPGPEINRWG